MSRVLLALSLNLISFFVTQEGFALSYAGKLVVDGKVFDGEADFHFSILDASNTQLWQSGLINGKTVPLKVSKGRYSIDLGGELTRPLSESVFLFGPSLKLRVQVDLRDGKGLQSAGADIPIQSVPLARSAQRAKQAKSAMVADSVLNGSVTGSTLSPELRETLALANDPERLKPENLSTSLRQYFANDLKPKFSASASPAIETMSDFDNSLIADMAAWYSADQIDGNLSVGDEVTFWNDRSGNRRHFWGHSGNPTVENSPAVSLPVVAFDGDDLLWTSEYFGFLTDTGYSIVSIARYSGSQNGRVISSRSRNFLFGFHFNSVRRWHAHGWIHNGSSMDENWHIHVGTIEAKGGDPAASFWIDGELLASNHKGSNNTTYDPGQFQLGGGWTNSEMSTCEVAEIMIFDRQISDSERLKLEGSLAHKWGIESDVLQANHPYYDYNPYGESQVVTLKAPAVMGENITYTWNKNGELIDGANSTSLSVSTNESAEYSVIAGNLFGSDQHTFSVSATPSPPSSENNVEPKPDVSHLINRKVVASWNNTFYIDENSSLWGVGVNWHGALGNGDGAPRSKFEKVVSGRVASVGTRDNQAFFIKDDGSLWGMGYNSNGQLGLGFFGGSRSTPVEIVDRGVIDLAVGSEHTLFLKHDGSLWGMGRNVEGQLGIGNNDRQSFPILIIDANVTEIACGYRSSYALKKDGSIWSWGHNAHGRLGDGTATNRNLPVKVVDANVSSISCVADHVLFLKKDGSAWGFGNNWEGRIGDGTGAQRSIPVKIIDDNVTAVFAGSQNSYFLREDHSLWGGGMGRKGALGIDTKNDYFPPVLIAENVDRVYASPRLFFTQFDTKLNGIGAGLFFDFGQLGEHYQDKPVQVIDSNVSDATSGNQHTVILKSDGSVWTVGSDSEGRLGNSTPDRHESEFQKIVEENASQISSHFKHTLLIKEDGSLWTFGGNWNGQLGDGSKSHQRVPKKIVDSNVTACAAGEQHSLFVKEDGSLWAMGQNHKGQLGDGTTTTRTSPVKIVDQNVTAVSAGQHYSLFLKNDGSVWSMGWNDRFRLGIGTDGDRNLPTMVMSSGAVAIDSGSVHSLILKSDGSLWALGTEGNGRLGLSRYGNRNNPSMVVESGVVDISAGGNHSLFVKNDGSVWGMGHNGYGQLGMEKSGDNNWPVRILESGASSVEASRNSFSFVVMKDGSLLGFGRDEDAQLGTGRMIRTHIPVTVAERIAE
jgi:alpha-tubulin suppressor-like RCC1 family protein